MNREKKEIHDKKKRSLYARINVNQLHLQIIYAVCLI